MKKSLLALAALSVVAGGAFAQSSVTIGGRIDLGVRNTNNGTNSLKTLSSNGGGSQQINIRGIEDLGGGLKASFWLESGLQLDVGSAGGSNRFGDAITGGNGAAFFNRRSTASLAGGFGEIRLGRDYLPTFWNLTVFDPFGTQGVGAYTNVFPGGGLASYLGAADIVRANNTLAYFLPALGGLYGQFQIAAGEGTPSALVPGATPDALPAQPARLGNKYIGGRLGYAAGPVNVAVAYGKRDTAVFFTGDELKSINVAGSYDFGVLKLIGQWGKNEIGTRETKHYQLATTVPIGPGVLKASYSVVKDNGVDLGAKQLAVGYVYSLSKRTSIYATYSILRNDDQAQYTTSQGSSPAGEALTPVKGKDPKAYEVGLGHNF